MTTTLAAPPPGAGHTEAAPTRAAPTRAAPTGRPRLRRVPYEPEPGSGTAPPPAGPAPPAAAPAVAGPTRVEELEAGRAVGPVLRVALEVLDGRRPLTQLAPHVDASVLRYWAVAVARRRVRRPARVTRVRLCLPDTGIAEAAVVCDIDGRVRALAARFERTSRAPAPWRCTALRLG